MMRIGLGRAFATEVLLTSPGPRSIQRAAWGRIIVGHKALSQVWLFIVAPLVGGALAAVSYRYFVPTEPVAIPSAIAEGDVERTSATPPA